MKKLRRDKVIEELKLMAYGANSGTFELSDDYEFSAIFRVLGGASMAKFAYAVRDFYFAECDFQQLCGFDITNIESWETFETLADRIIEERKRLDAIAKATKETDHE